MTDLATEEGVIRSLYPVARLRRLGIPVRTAMQCDVNGYPWALAELLRDAGITGLVGGINVTRSTLPFDFPRAITWESPCGGGVLAWRGEHYMKANFLGLEESLEKTASLLPPYLGKLEAAGYPYDVALLQMAGYYTDNAAPSRRVCDLVRRWNETSDPPAADRDGVGVLRRPRAATRRARVSQGLAGLVGGRGGIRRRRDGGRPRGAGEDRLRRDVPRDRPGPRGLPGLEGDPRGSLPAGPPLQRAHLRRRGASIDRSA